MPYVPSDKIRLWFGLLLAGTTSTFWAVWFFATASGVLPTNRFSAFGVIGNIVLGIGFGAFGIWAAAKGLLLRKTNPTLTGWPSGQRAKIR